MHLKSPKKPGMITPALRSFLAFCRPWRGRLLMVFAVFVVANLVLAVQPIFIGHLIDAVSKQPIETSAAWLAAWILVGISIGHNLFWRAAEFMYRSMILPIAYRYETRLFSEIMSKPYPYFADKFTGKISSNITTISTELRWTLDNALFDYTGSLVNVVAVVLIMTSINWQTGAIVVFSLLGMYLTGRYTLARDMHFEQIKTDVNATKNGHIIDSIANFVSVKAFHTEATETQTIDRQQDKTIVAAKKAMLWGIFFWGSMSIFVRDLMWPAVVLLNLWFMLNGQITIGEFTTVLSTALLFTQTIWEVVWNIGQFAQRRARIDEAHSYLFGSELLPVAAEPIGRATKDKPFKQHLSIEGLSFAYPDKPDDLVLKDISIDMKQGEKIGIVGRSGSGKTTLTKLLLDYYDVPKGTFSFDGRPVGSDEIFRHIAYVPQDTSLFHRSIADNIAYGAGSAVSREQIIQAAIESEADEFISKLPSGYDTLVGERGVKLSGGQRQRIAIARAMLRDAPILILDEATSALDSESEVHVQHALERLWENKTVIAIAHRLSTLRHMDRIIVIDDGRIIEEGAHAELLAQSGIYAKLWSHQSGGFIEE